ncbi:hypothetical protein LY13_003141 [Prauserella aidingensis]|uniref:hypothetical protein n=1 Tax=Prauserella aidingensis TaxID=387890 RepID=UPI0020A248EF|nr:hypothetical protein [Prauserella aidingensis]MCP2254372.1 hypothetical protein [Prauserella aidingensis]
MAATGIRAPIWAATLIRRSGLRAALGYDPTSYGHKLSSVHHNKLVHVVDLWRWVHREFSARDLIADMPLPKHTPLHNLLSMIERGRQEIDTMLDKAGFRPPASDVSVTQQAAYPSGHRSLRSGGVSSRNDSDRLRPTGLPPRTPP